MQECQIVDQEQEIDLYAAGADIARSIEELACVCNEKYLSLNVDKLKQSLLPRLKVVLHGLQNK